MRVHVADLTGHPGATRRVDVDVPRAQADPDRGPMDEVLDTPVTLGLDLEMLVDGLLVRGDLAFATAVPCARCLTAVRADHDVHVVELYRDPRRLPPDEEVEAGYELLPVGEIDVGALVRDAVTSTLPVRTLCSPDCRGLCPVCGTDRNVEECGHDTRPATDPRWAVLSQLDLSGSGGGAAADRAGRAT